MYSLRPTGKLELPSISQVHTRDAVDIPFYNHHAVQRPSLGGDKFRSLCLPDPQSTVSGLNPIITTTTTTTKPDSFGSSTYLPPTSHTAGAAAGEPATYSLAQESRLSQSSSAEEAGGLHSRQHQQQQQQQQQAPPLPPPQQEPTRQLDYIGSGEGYIQNPNNLGSMNQTQSYPPEVHSSHLPPAAQPYSTSQPGPVETIPHYTYQQPPLLQPGPPQSYPPPPPPSSTYPYGYSNTVTSPQSSSQQPVTNAVVSYAAGPSQILPLPAMTTPPSHGYGASNSHTPPYNVPHTFDTTGQIAPPGMKPRVTATLWEDEGSLCFQVEAKGVCVARREDNHMINGTKLLNVAGMTRGRRDGILKSEKVRHVVKIGPMHLKGVWIPFDRALEFANKEKITDQLYPLFVHNIGGLLYHPANQTRPNAIAAANERRRLEATQQQQQPGRPGPGPGPGPQPSALHHHHHAMQNPVPPQVTQSPSQGMIPAGRPSFERAHTFPTPPASASSLVGVAGQGSSYDWAGNVHNSHALSIDTGLGSSRSMPTTPATTPPGSNMQNMQNYQSQQSYDPKPYYSSAQSSQSQFPPQQQPGSSQGNGHTNAVGEGPQEHEQEYINDANGAYSSNRGSYSYSSNHSSGTMPGPESGHIPSDGSTNGDRRGPDGSNQWNTGYPTPRLARPGSLYNVVSETRGPSTTTTSNGAPAGDPYPVSSSAPSYSPSMNGSNKRARDEDDQEEPQRPSSQNCDTTYEHKRRKTLTDNPVGGGPVGGPTSSIAHQGMKNGGMSRRR